ncbi:DUF3545 family protein [Pseudocolwellia agarivorans]|uniref:DUF3545 family protein n=1 Tax=Pseudocolwellia agarivorans TaxID=1911682 RepID=UPI0009872247|nr:DUF3545 family protein [Pseudocolwellia agarivorans]
MNTFQETLGSLDTQAKSNKSNKKRKWREIELLKDQHQLEKELKAFDDSFEYMFDDY